MKRKPTPTLSWWMVRQAVVGGFTHIPIAIGRFDVNKQAHVLMDAARYLQERADDAEIDDTRGGASCSKSTYSSTGTDNMRTSSSKTGGGKSSAEGRSSTSYCSTNVTSNEEERKPLNVADQKKLRESLENLVTYFARRADETGEREWSVITGIAERLLFDVSECIQCERPMTRELLSRIKGLNRLAREATLKVC
ncbi:hypothetical protein Y032_0205g1910 [Ancylostoma ceylanicum]|uniref:Uncharacterized protein n=2 Tax=Ancylostoma ceylanicum TaxID=53326 RepID=A0A016SL68_9BILA|nr:hypothetical protein Y032_0205g1910 [Ancylostoma ceylanicum]